MNPKRLRLSSRRCPLRRKLPLLIRLAALLACGLSVGCAAHPPTSPYSCTLTQQPEYCRANVHVLIVDSPVDVARISRMYDVESLFRNSGLANTCTHNLYRDGDARQLQQRIVSLREQHPGCRIMLISYSSGALIAQDALQRLQRCGVRLDTVIYLDSAMLNIVGAGKRPANVDRHVLIYRDGHPAPSDLCNASVHRVDEWNHLAVPTSQHALDVLLYETLQLVSAGCQNDAASSGNAASASYDCVTAASHGDNAPGSVCWSGGDASRQNGHGGSSSRSAATP